MRLFLIVFLFTCLKVVGQDVIKFTRGLAAGPAHQYGRQAIITDELAYQLNQNKLLKPAAGSLFYTNKNSDSVIWRDVEADTSGMFRGEALRNGYLYLTYKSEKEQSALLNISGNAMFYFNGEPHAGDIYRDGWLYVPVKLRKGLNEIYVRCSPWGGVKARLILAPQPIALGTEDVTLPHIVIDDTQKILWAALVVTNNTDRELASFQIESIMEGKSELTKIPVVPARSFRKVGFQFNPARVSQKGSYACRVLLKDKSNKVIDEKVISIDAVEPSQHYSVTFRSAIDGSIQYYSVAPASRVEKNQAMFFSVHGAGVEAIGQARAYAPKSWGNLIAPTNRRPRGFNWEDWGRLDALEVLKLANEKFSPDSTRIYLTGHSMGGHGTWYLGATYPEKWAAIAPCAGYPTLTGYGSADGKIPTAAQSDHERILLRASNPSDVIELANNYKPLGIYIHHGDSDKVVSVDYARQMRGILSGFHKDFSYYEYPGGSHWFGNESVDWPPIFDYFKWHTIKPDSAYDNVDFSTANTAISSSFRWVTIEQQQHSLAYSRVKIARNRPNKTIIGSTENVSILKLNLAAFQNDDKITIVLDTDSIIVTPGVAKLIFLRRTDKWSIQKNVIEGQKGVKRNGTFKEAFKNQMVFIYSTKGNPDENKWSYSKARYDAEVWYYRGNGSVDIIADKDFHPRDFADRGVILYGNASTNAAWDKLLKDCPLQFKRGTLSINGKVFNGSDLGGYFVWPRHDSDIASVGVVSGTGLTGMKTADGNQYFAGGSGYPDYLIFNSHFVKDGATGIVATGFYENDWSVSK